jgi:predicted O-methyltransferase YrrM
MQSNTGGCRMRSALKSFIGLKKDTEAKYMCAEIGVKEGRHSAEIMDHLPNCTMICVDPYLAYFTESFNETQQEYNDDKYRQVLEMIEKYNDRAKLYKMKSHEAAPLFEDNTFDFIYIDGDHSKEGVRLDIECWLPKVKVGGIISGHDWAILAPFITDMLGEIFFDSGDMESRTSCLDWWVIKK